MLFRDKDDADERGVGKGDERSAQPSSSPAFGGGGGGHG